MVLWLAFADVLMARNEGGLSFDNPSMLLLRLDGEGKSSLPLP